jgi:hypothetical protein
MPACPICVYIGARDEAIARKLWDSLPLSNANARSSFSTTFVSRVGRALIFMPAKICSATTLKSSVEQTLNFVHYHLSLGIDHLFLFFDDPYDKSIELLKDYSNVTCINGSDKIKQ